MAENTSNHSETPETQLSDHLSQWWHLMQQSGLSVDDLKAAIDDASLRQRMVRYWRSGANATLSDIGAGLFEFGGFVNGHYYRPTDPFIAELRELVEGR